MYNDFTIQGGWIFLPCIFLPFVVSHILVLFATKIWFEILLDLFVTLKSTENCSIGRFGDLGNSSQTENRHENAKIRLFP